MSPKHQGGLVGRPRDSLTSQEQILLAALVRFVKSGYHGTTIRQIAGEAGVSVPGLYHHFPSKLALLEQLIDDTMDDLIEATEAAYAAAPNDPVSRLSAVVSAHVWFHCDRPEESFVGNTELRSLSRKGRVRTVAKRDHQQRIFDRTIEEGAASGVFAVTTPREASRAIVTMCTAVATWYHRDGPASAEQIVNTYRDLSLNMAGFAGSGRRSRAA